jgi:hypothetical protein
MQLGHVWELAKFHLADWNIAPSEFMARYVELHYDLSKVCAFKSVFMGSIKSRANSVAAAEKTPDLQSDAFNVCCIARFEGRKKQEFLIRQFIKFIDCTGAKANLFLAGNSCLSDIDGTSCIDTAFSSVPDHYRDRIHFFDFMPQSQHAQLLGASDLYVLPSTFESFGFSIVETVYRGMPIMCSKYCGTAEAMSDVRAQMTFDPFAGDDLAHKIQYFYQLSEIERDTIAKSQQVSFVTALGAQALDVKVKALFTTRTPVDYLDISGMPCIFVTEAGIIGHTGNGPSHYVLCKEIDHHAGSFLAFHMQISPKLLDSVLMFCPGDPALNLEEAVEQGCSLAFPSTKFAFGNYPYQDLIRAALKLNRFIPVPTERASGASKIFSSFLVQETQRINMKMLLESAAPPQGSIP